MSTRRRRMLVAGFLGLMVVLGGLMQAYSAGEKVTVKGELVDTYCYALMGAKGESHRQCAIDCVKAGIPAGILEEKTGKVYVLLPNKDKAGLPKEVIDNMGRTVNVTGKVYVSGGSNFLTVESVK